VFTPFSVTASVWPGEAVLGTAAEITGVPAGSNSFSKPVTMKTAIWPRVRVWFGQNRPPPQPAVIYPSFPTAQLQNIDRTLIQSDPGVLYYCLLAKVFRADLLLNPIRAKRLLESGISTPLTYGRFAQDLLQTLDGALKDKVASLGSEILKRGVVPNFNVPSVANLANV
jgi:hypothetical protein